MHEDTFEGLASSHIYERVPEASRSELIRLSTGLTHATEWRWIGGHQVYTTAGLTALADGLDAAGHGVAALVVRRELQLGLGACAARGRPAVTVPAEEDHEADILAKRWDLRKDLA